MEHKGGMFRVLFIITAISTLTFSFCAQAVSNGDLIINKIQITGGAGKTSQDYISIYNKSSSVIDLNGLRLVKRTKTGTSDTTIKSWVSPNLINPGDYHLWANSSDGFAVSLNAQSDSSQTIADDNGIALREGAENTGTIIDSFAFGQANNIFIETQVYPNNHLAGQYYARINNQDTNNNALDWQILDYVVPAVCGNGQIETGENCDDNNTTANDGCDNSCQLEISISICGNSNLETGETCDDGNVISGDGCSKLCQIENLISKNGDVRINEVVADPANGDEWLELYNTTSQEIDLNNWTIEDGSSTKTLLSTKINQWLVITKPKGALNNSGDVVTLKNQDGDIIDTMTYGDWDDGEISNNAPAAAKPYALARIHDGESTNIDNADFKITSTITKGLANIITEPIEESEAAPDTNQSDYNYSQNIIISEIFPNPLGLDNEANNGEFIELFNKGNEAVNLSGWRIESGNQVMEIKQTILAQEYLSLATKNILPLANDGGTIKLFQPLKQTSYQSISYKKAEAGKSYANFLNSAWQWTNQTTPGFANILALEPQVSFDLINDPIVNQATNFDSSDSFLANKTAIYSWNFGDKTTSKLANPSHVFTKTGKHLVSLTIKTDYGTSTSSKTITVLKAETLDQTEPLTEAKANLNLAQETTTETVKSAKENSRLIVQGLAVLAPGVFGSQYFFLLPDHGEPLYEIYNYKKLFPKIKSGDRLEITGDYSEKPDGPQVKTKTADDIKIIGQAELTKPALSFSSDLKFPPYPRLALVEGEVVSKKSPKIYLADEQGEIELYLRAGSKLKVSDFTIGDRLLVFGVLTTANGSARLEPRSLEDISKTETTDFNAASLEIPSSPSNKINLENQSNTNNKKITFYYLIAGSIIMISVVIYFIYKK